MYPPEVPRLPALFPKSALLVSKLLIVPTQFELECLSSSFRKQISQSDWQLELCGFGIVVSGLRASKLISLHSPNQVLLIGIAGALDLRSPIGQAVQFDEVACFGIGAGSGDDYLSAQEMGWHQWPDEPEISDSLPLEQTWYTDIPIQPAKLLTCCSASACAHDVQSRLTKHPNAVAEDMEGFAVAAACRFAGIPLTIIRGISNLAGDRNKENWRVREAMMAVEKQIGKVLGT